MKTRLFTLLAVLAVLAMLIPTTAAFASTDNQVQFTGKIQSLPQNGLIGIWQVGGRTVHVKATTQIDQSDGAAVVGATATVEGRLRKDGSVKATSIDVLAKHNSGQSLAGAKASGQ
jgi:Domain of unknown function (DUF5666)